MSEADWYERKVRPRRALTFDDVLLLPGRADFLPNEAVLDAPLARDLVLRIPIISAAMDKVTEARTAITMAREGGIGVIHKNFKPDVQAREVERVKRTTSSVVVTPVTVGPDDSIAAAINITAARKVSGLPVVKDGRLVGILTARDIRAGKQTPAAPVSAFMTPRAELTVGGPGIDHADARRRLDESRKEKLPLVDADDTLVGLITLRDLLRAREYPNAVYDKKGRLLVAAAIGPSADVGERIAMLVAAGVDALVIDTSHGHSRGVLQLIQQVKAGYPEMPLIAGNIATAQAAEELFEAGADTVKIGIGPGSICTTRVVSGAGVPQIDAILEIAPVARGYGRHVIADGGIKYSGDITKALAAGAHTVMMGSLLAGTDEAPGEVMTSEGRLVKSYRGMGSVAAMKSGDGARDRYHQDRDAPEEKLVPQGVEATVPYRGPLAEVLHQYTGGLRAGMGLTGCRTIRDLHERAQFVEQSSLGMRESHVHGVQVTAAAPNYNPGS